MVRHEQLWAPWRLAYISGEAGSAAADLPPQQSQPQPRFLPGADPECFLCRAIGLEDDRANLLVERASLCLVMLNRFPYNNGHLLVAPLAHKGRLDELNDAEQLEISQLITKYTGLIQHLMRAEGFNVGLNLGRAGGAGLPGHLHWHIVPRWTGDNNFMPVMAGIRVIPQSLDALWEMLHQANARDSQGDDPAD